MINMAVYTAPTFIDGQAPPINAANLNALAQCAESSQTLLFESVALDSTYFSSDSTYLEYPVRAAIPLSGVTADMIPTVVFLPTDATSGNFAPVAQAYAGGIYVYAKTAITTTVATIACVKGVS